MDRQLHTPSDPPAQGNHVAEPQESGSVRSPFFRAMRKWTVPVLILFSVLIYLSTLISAYGGYFNPDTWTLPSIGLLFFPYFAMATLIVAAVWLILRRYVIGAVGVAVLLACGPTFTEALPFRFANTSTDKSRTFKLITFNCLHMQDLKEENPENNRSLHFLIHSGADFICLQELYAFAPPEINVKYSSQIDSLLTIYPYYSVDGGREVEFVSKYPFHQLEVKLDDDIKYGSCAAYELTVDNRKLTIINVHLPSYLLSPTERQIITDAGSQNGVKNSIREFEGSVYKKMKNAFAQRSRVSEAIARFAQSLDGNVIICGDFNDVPGSWSYRNFTKRGFEDAYAQTGFGHLITYNQHLMFFHIDQILYRGEMVPLYVRKEKLSASDHYPLVAEFEFL